MHREAFRVMSLSSSPTGHAGTHVPVAITGIGAVSGYGWGEKRLREGLFGARSSVRMVRGFLPWAPARSLWLSLVQDEGNGDPGRRARALRFAARDALADAHDRGWRPAPGVGVIHGAEWADDTWRQLAHELELDGPGMCVASGELSAVMAVLTAKSWIGAGLADDVLVVCSDLSLTPERCLNGPSQSGLVVDSAPSVTCLPFQQGSVGANPGEAVIAMVVTRWSASPYGRVLGGAAAVAERSTGFEPADDREARRTALGRAVTRALETSLVEPDAVAYLNAHGSGQPMSDAVEASVLEGWLPATRGLYSLKPLVGDCGAAAGAVELLAALYGFSTGVVPAPGRVAAGHRLLLDGPTAAMDGIVVKASLGPTGECAVVVAGA
jgi:3-oxoacyl-[acyl-carrier-protein] synthase II